MKILPWLLALLIALSTPSRAAVEFEARTHSAADGASIPYRLLIPKGYDAQKKYPLVLFLHGAGERGTDNSAQLKHGAGAFASDAAQEKFPCFVMAPQCPPDQKWADIDWASDNPTLPAKVSAPMALVLAALESLQKEFKIDADRLYLTGLSMGGFGTWDLITRFPERFAAAVPICGGGDKTKVASAKNVPIWAFHGELDGVVKLPRTTDLTSALIAAGGKPLFTLYPTVGHDSWTGAYTEPGLLPWIFAQRRGQSAVSFEKAAGPHAMPPTSAFPGDGPTQPGDWFRKLWNERRSEWSAARDKDQGAVVFFGDSITQGWGSMVADFPGLKVANRGISGDTTRGLRYRVAEDVLSLKPKAVTLLIGTNDLGLLAEPALVAENIQAIIAELHRANPAMPVVINKVMPRGASAGRFPEKIQELNALLEKAYAANPKVTFCDTWTLFADANGAPKPEEFPDKLHPNEAGYAKWAAALRPILERLELGAK